MFLRLNTSECLTLGDVITVNMTMVKGGVAYNVIPSEMDISFDLRIPPTVNLQVRYPELLLPVRHGCSRLLFPGLLLIHLVKTHSQVKVKPVLTCKLLQFYQEFERQIKAWCHEAGEDVTYEFAQVSSPARPNVLFL